METVTNIVQAKKHVIGVEVKNEMKENIGKVDEIALEKFSGQVAYVILDCGSFLGMGGTLHAIPWKSLHYDINEQCFILKNAYRLNDAPAFKKESWPNLTDKHWGKSILDYWY